MEYQETPQIWPTVPLNAQEMALLEAFRQMNEQAKQDVMRVVNALLGLPA